MSKIIVECKVPAAGKCDDIAIPYEAPLVHTLALLKSIYSDNEGFLPDESTLLCDSKTGDILSPACSPEELGLVNGSSIMLI